MLSVVVVDDGKNDIHVYKKAENEKYNKKQHIPLVGIKSGHPAR